MGDHTECFQVDFDPAVISYEELLELFWQSHDATRAAHKVQYASLVLTHDDTQLTTARESAERMARLYGRPLATRIEPIGSFWMAEDYHQKYYLRNDRVLMGDFRAMFGVDDAAFVSSTAAAKVNGFAAGAGTREQLRGIIDSLGLSEAGRSRLVSTVNRSSNGIGCSIG